MPPAGPTEFDLAHMYGGMPFGTLPIRPTILSYLTDYARTHGDAPFITAVSAEGDLVSLSYGELDILSRRFACWLKRELRVGFGDVLALLPANDVPSVIAIFGLLRSGCPILFLNPADPMGRLHQQAKALGVKAILRVAAVSGDSCLETILAPDASTLDEDFKNDPDPPIEPFASALFFGTSGSTASSKLVAQSHYNAAVNAEALRRHHRLRRSDRILGCLPIHHVNCLHFTIFATLTACAHAILASSFSPFDYPRLIGQFRPRIASVVPSILEALLGIWRQPIFPREFNYFVSAAAPLTARTVRAVAEKMGVRVCQGYGLTETTNFSTTIPTDLSQERYQRLVLDAEIPPIGSALYGNEVAVLTAQGDHAAPGEIGEICIRGHNVMVGYAGNAAATSKAFRNGWFHSEDLGFEIEGSEPGRPFFVITGRTKNIAKVRGESVSLDEMDRVLRGLPQVIDAACVSVPHPLLGEEVIAAVVCSKDTREIDLRTQLRAAFAAAVLPSRIVTIDVIPRTATGKILRARLTQELASLSDQAVQQD